MFECNSWSLAALVVFGVIGLVFLVIFIVITALEAFWKEVKKQARIELSGEIHGLYSCLKPSDPMKAILEKKVLEDRLLKIEATLPKKKLSKSS